VRLGSNQNASALTDSTNQTGHQATGKASFVLLFPCAGFSNGHIFSAFKRPDSEISLGLLLLIFWNWGQSAKPVADSGFLWLFKTYF
jgi:hypothetical protein